MPSTIHSMKAEHTQIVFFSLFTLYVCTSPAHGQIDLSLEGKAVLLISHILICLQEHAYVLHVPHLAIMATLVSASVIEYA